MFLTKLNMCGTSFLLLCQDRAANSHMWTETSYTAIIAFQVKKIIQIAWYAYYS